MTTVSNDFMPIECSRFYCKLCDYGSFSKDLLEKHNLTEKHKKHEYNLK